MGSIGRCNGEALVTIEKIMDDTTSYYPNKVYKNAEYNLYWLINSKGYIHVLKPCKVTLEGKLLHYVIEDNLLTADNMVQLKGSNGNYTTVQEVIEELERRIA